MILRSSPSVLMYILFISNFSASKKLTVPVSGGTKISECQRCRILTDSFNYWMEVTSRGKFEGGDAAWEEAKLKSYSRSEIRLVEVQEGLCSEVKKHQDQCYTIADEAEQPLEQWWFHKDTDSLDLYTWLCIETLQHCCPSYHFGTTCTPCPLDKNSKICSGNGKCSGEGTRTGNGSCICKKGYSGSLCDNCSDNFFSADNKCKECDKSCQGCSGEGPASCAYCRPGWSMEEGICVDINECSTSVCNENQYCVNKEGSYSCKLCDKSCGSCLGEGPSNCTSCKPSFLLWGGYCVDEKSKSELSIAIINRIALYCGLFMISYFIFRKSKILASLVVLVIAIFIYASENSSNVKILDFLRIYIQKNKINIKY